MSHTHKYVFMSVMHRANYLMTDNTINFITCVMNGHAVAVVM